MADEAPAAVDRVIGGDLAQHPVYRTQQARFEASFAGKTETIAKQFIMFANDPPGSPRDKTWLGTRFAQDEKAFLLSNHASFDVVQYPDRPDRASMSMIHILAVPHAPIYNAVTLTGDDVAIVDDMVALFRASWARPEIRRSIVDYQRVAIERRAREDESPAAGAALAVALAHHAQLAADIDAIRFEDFQFGFHLRPDHSADHLHLHIILAGARYRQYSTSAHDLKTKDAFEVRQYVLDEAAAEREALDGRL